MSWWWVARGDEDDDAGCIGVVCWMKVSIKLLETRQGLRGNLDYVLQVFPFKLLAYPCDLFKWSGTDKLPQQKYPQQ